VAVPPPPNLFKRTRRMPFKLTSHGPTRRRVRALPRGPSESESLRASGCCAQGLRSRPRFLWCVGVWSPNRRGHAQASHVRRPRRRLRPGVTWRILAARGAANAAQRPAVLELPVPVTMEVSRRADSDSDVRVDSVKLRRPRAHWPVLTSADSEHVVAHTEDHADRDITCTIMPVAARPQVDS
jgi:hypothetical protein